LLRTGPDRDAQQTKQYVCVCARACVQYPMWLRQMLHRQRIRPW
jgi:hypothetical protein